MRAFVCNKDGSNVSHSGQDFARVARGYLTRLSALILEGQGMKQHGPRSTKHLGVDSGQIEFRTQE